MDTLSSQLSYPVLLYLLWVFFLIASTFGLIVGLGLALHSPAMLRFINFMNRWVSVRKMMKPLVIPHFIEPVVMKQPTRLGMVITPGATTAVMLLNAIPAESLQPIFLGPMTYGSAVVLSEYTKWFLLISNGLCIVVGLLLLFAPHLITRLQRYTDTWHSVRKHTKPLTQMHLEVDQWVLAHSTIAGLTLIALSLGLGFTMYGRI